MNLSTLKSAMIRKFHEARAKREGRELSALDAAARDKSTDNDPMLGPPKRLEFKGQLLLDPSETISEGEFKTRARMLGLSEATLQRLLRISRILLSRQQSSQPTPPAPSAA